MRGGGVTVRCTLVLSILVCIGGCAFAQSSGIDFVSGSFSQILHVDFLATAVEDIILYPETRFDMRINWVNVEIEPELHLSELQSSSLQLSAWVYTGATEFRSRLGFDLVKPQSHFLQFGWETNAFGATYGPTFLLVHNPWDPTPADLKVDFSFQGQTVAGMTVTLVATFGNYVDPTGGVYIRPSAWPNTGDTDGVCDLSFAGAEIRVSGFQFCCAEPSISISFDASGFDNITFSVSTIRIENLPWLTLSGLLTFAPDEKSMTISPSIDLGAFEGCLTVVWARSGVTTGNPPGGPIPAVESIDISGIELLCTLGEVTVRGRFLVDSATSIDINNYNREDFDPDEDCCDGLRWGVSVRFSDSGTYLFDVSNFSARMEYYLTSRFSWLAAMDISLDPVSPSTQWYFGFDIRFGP